MEELANPSAASKMSILNLFVLELNNTQRRKPAPCLAFRPISLILACLKYSKNK